jgi:hypothetical protein
MDYYVIQNGVMLQITRTLCPQARFNHGQSIAMGKLMKSPVQFVDPARNALRIPFFVVLIDADREPLFWKVSQGLRVDELPCVHSSNPLFGGKKETAKMWLHSRRVLWLIFTLMTIADSTDIVSQAMGPQ